MVAFARRADAGHPEGRYRGDGGVDAGAHPARGASACRLPRLSFPARGSIRTSSVTRTTRPVAGALVFRVEASLFYFNVEHVRAALWQKIRSGAAPLRLVICDLSTSPVVDLAGARMLKTLHVELREAGMDFRLVGAHAKVRDILRAEGIEERVGHLGRRLTVADVIDDFRSGANDGVCA